MERSKRIAAFAHLGNFLKEFTRPGEWKDYQNGVSQSDHLEFNEAIEMAYTYNGWFMSTEVRRAIGGISNWLTQTSLENWVAPYPEITKPKKVAVIMAGNIPLVGFHDVMSVLISGHHVICRFSGDDNKLLPLVLKYLAQIEPDFNNYIRVSSGKLTEFDAVIATGSNNSSRYFDYYFGKYPHIIRKNRTSVAVLSGDETEAEMEALGHDIFDYYGLGCRNVGKLFIPEGFDLNRVFQGLFPFKEIINHNKYANNYDYHKALYLLNKDDLLENGFILFKKDESIHSPLAVIFYETYIDKKEVLNKINTLRDEIQCVVGRGFIEFGKTQQPAITDYADGVDTLKFLSILGA